MKQTRTVKIFNTLTRQIEVLTPTTPNEVKLYCCGPTVYNYQHIGNLRTYIFEDILVRTLKLAGYKTTHIMNVTDVGHLVSDADDGEDKMLVAAKREGKKSEEVAEFYTKIFLEHCSWLNIQRPDTICKATEHIPQMIELIKRLEAKGLAYQSEGNVYFNVGEFPNYGKLAQLNLEQLQAGARIEVDKNKKHPLDFALWFTKSKFENQELQWESPWGRGYPGWHIECSAMAMHYLGESFDIHCGGIDHIPVHHTNEIAQSEGATNKPFSKIWMHGGFLVIGKDKMSKSTGGFLTLDLIKEKGFDPICYRLFCLSGSYRQELSWGWEALESASNSLKRIKNLVLSLKESATKEQLLTEAALQLKVQFEECCFADLNMPQALAIVHEVCSHSQLTNSEKLSLLYHFDEVLGLGIKTWQADLIPQEILELVEQRTNARKNKDFKEADRIRDQITDLGYTVEDYADGAKVKKR
jgi:cysteinyl-tRNA synthetase